MSLPLALFHDLRANRCIQNGDAYWPEADRILASMPSVKNKQLDTFGVHATSWASQHFGQPWAPETHAFFALQLRERDAQRSIEGVAALLRLWTKAGTLLPRQSYQHEIGQYLSKCDSATGMRLLSFAPGASATLPHEIKQTWLSQAIPYAQSRSDALNSPVSLFAYFNGGHDALNQEQKDAGLRWTVEPSTTWPPPLMAGPILANNHPEPARLQLAFLHRTLHAAFRQKDVPGAWLELQTAFHNTLGHWPASTCTQTMHHQTQLLVLGVLFERFVPGTLSALAGPWGPVRDLLAMVESLHALPWSPLESVPVVSELAAALMPLLKMRAEDAAPAPLPANFLASP